MATGLLLGAISALLVTLLPVTTGWRSAVMAAWLFLTGVELAVLASVYRRVSGYRIEPGGGVAVRSLRGPETAARLIPGSVVLNRFAWLRFVTARGASWGELLARGSQDPDDWRKLRVICRHLAAC